MTTPLGPDSRVSVFVTQTGKVHKAAFYVWGPGMACSDAFVLGTSTEALVRDIDCERCRAHDLPGTWEIRIPDRRYKSGYRVVSSGIASEAEADQMVGSIKSSPNFNGAHDPYVVAVKPGEGE